MGKISVQNLLNLDQDFDLTDTALETAEIDLILHEDASAQDKIDALPQENIPKRVKTGQVWQLGEHLIACADALLKTSYERLLGQEKASIVASDSPFNLNILDICGNGKTKHKNFAMGGGEMSSEQFTNFLKTVFKNVSAFSTDGSLQYWFMDWRHCKEIITAGESVFSQLKNIAVWNKLSGGMGSLYRSQHELVFIYKNGTASHTNNIELGVHGRYRTNVWDYPGIFINNHVNKENIKLHPTVKPVGLLADILLDASKRGDIVLDPFGGSGSTLLAAERTGRKARLLEIEPHYCDVTIYRWEKMTKQKAKLLKEEK